VPVLKVLVLAEIALQGVIAHCKRLPEHALALEPLHLLAPVLKVLVRVEIVLKAATAL
jgi:hypothetical protein